MALPPKTDPQRPLALAVRSTRVLGIVFIGIGALGMLPTFTMGMRGAGGATLSIATMALIVVTATLTYFGPGALYLVCSNFIARRRKWAIVTAMVLAGIQILLICAGLVTLTTVYFSPAPQARSSAVLIPLALTLLILLALAQLEYHLWRCFEAIRLSPVDMQRGFDTLQPASVIPLASAPPPRAARGERDPIGTRGTS